MGYEAVPTGISVNSAKVILKVMGEVKGKLRIESSLQKALIKDLGPVRGRSAGAQLALRLRSG